jgi:hypothetical protein
MASETEHRRRLPAAALLVASLPCVLALSCGAQLIVHDEEAAAKVAEHFASVAFVDHDSQNAHGLLSVEARNAVSREQLSDTIAKMHPREFPTRVKAVEFEPMPGQRAMLIYLNGSATDEEFYYRLQVVGDATLGYEVSGLWRGSGPYPPSARRPL